MNKTGNTYNYGSKRIGVVDTNTLVGAQSVSCSCTPPSNPFDSSTIGYLEGQKQYELTNHLGNVLVTVSDGKTPVDTDLLHGKDTAYYYTAIVVNAQDYYPFGMIEPGRSYILNGDSTYKYGFNGKYHDDNIYGKDNSYDYGMRFYDPRLGRFMSVDPLTKKYPELTPYQFSSNSPIDSKDLDGLERIYYLGAFANSGNSVLQLLDKAQIYTQAVKTFQDVNKNKGYNLIVVDANTHVGAGGETSNARGQTFGFTNAQLNDILNAKDVKQAILDQAAGYLEAPQITDAFIAAVKETVADKRNLIISTVNQDDVNATGNSAKAKAERTSAAKTTAHEVIAHALEDAQETDVSRQDKQDGNAEHKKYFGARDKNGNLKPNPCPACGGDNGKHYSPPDDNVDPTSTAGKVDKQIDNAANIQKK